MFALGVAPPPKVDPDDVTTHPLLMDDKLRRDWFACMEASFQAPRRYVPGGWGPIDDYYVRTPGSVVFYDEIQPDHDQGDAARIEYLKQITMETYDTPHRTVQQIRRERRAEHALRDNESVATARRAQWQIPTRA